MLKFLFYDLLTVIAIEVVLSPALLPFYEVKGKTVVIIDILRATSSICVAFKNRVERILPVSTVEEALSYKAFGFIAAAERNAIKAEGADLGNSPFEFENTQLAGKSIAFTTTNGTKAINYCKKYDVKKILIGSFLNIDVLCSKLADDENDVILLCSGWKDKINTEDTLFAGAVVEKLASVSNIESDGCQLAHSLYQLNKNNLSGLVYQSNHAKRFKLKYGHTNDVDYCLQQNTINLVPYLKGEYLVV